MISVLTKLFIHDSDNVSDPSVRRAYGTLCGVLGIVLNLILFVAKLLIGLLSGSVAVTADAVNNLSDAGSSVITLLGFAIAGKKPDPEHPFGHGRAEYLAGLALAALIIVMGFELASSSLGKILAPSPVEFGIASALVLLASVLVKLYMAYYNRKLGKKINSAAMLAAATDSVSDSVSTLVVLLTMALSHFTDLTLDGWAGLAVAVFVLIAGCKAAMDTVSPLLGRAPSPELVHQVEDIVLAFPEITGIHDLIAHDYGPGRLVVSLHAEVDGHGDIFHLHDAVDRAERELKEKLGCLATIHLDPLELESSEVGQHRTQVTELLQREISPAISVHDFRMVPGSTHINLIFDAVVPIDYPEKDDELAARIRRLVHAEWDDHYAVVTIDRAYI